MMRWCVLGAFLAACAPEGSGTAVGNPGEMDVVLVGVPYDVQLRQADFAVTAVELVGCDGHVQVLTLNAVFDTLRPSPVEVPAGEWCSTVVLPVGKDSLVLAGTDGGGDFMFSLSPDPFTLDGAYEIDGNTVLVTLSVRADGQALSDAQPAEPEPGAPPPENDDESRLAADLVVPEGLFVDTNADYLADDDELAAVLAEREDCGCSTSGFSPGWLALLALGGILRRRSRPGRPTPLG